MILIADTETTGLKADAKLVELGYSEITADLDILEQFESLIDPECHINFGASGTNHILDEHVQNSPTAEELFDIVLKDRDFSDVTLICHNLVFDIRFLSPYMNVTKKICTLRLAKRFYPNAESHKLMGLAYELKLPLPEGSAHRAGYDVAVTFELLKRLMLDTGHSLQDFIEILNTPQRIDKIKFGKHSGAKLSDLPASYIEWLLKQETLDSDLRWSLEELAN